MKKSQVLSDNELQAEATEFGFNVLGQESKKRFFKASEIGRMPSEVRTHYQTTQNQYHKQALAKDRQKQGLPGIKPDFLQKKEQAEKEGFDRLV